MSRKSHGNEDEMRSRMRETEKVLEEHKSDQKAINAGKLVTMRENTYNVHITFTYHGKPTVVGIWTKRKISKHGFSVLTVKYMVLIYMHSRTCVFLTCFIFCDRMMSVLCPSVRSSVQTYTYFSSYGNSR